ncbi:hypothetical protein, variant [Phialophora macrospora]|nr:hypothetical protein, variant [Phialophora macrospora]
MPCTTCLSKRQKPRCYYLNPPTRRGEGDMRVKGSPSSSNRGWFYSSTARQEIVWPAEDTMAGLSHVVAGPHNDFCGMFSLARSVKEFKELFPAEGQSKHFIDSTEGVQVFGLESPRPEVVSASYPVVAGQTGLDLSSQLSPPLQRLYAKYCFVRDLLASGRSTQAWSAFGSLVRDAELFGLEEHANSASTWDSQPSRHLWWLIVELDTQLSFLLGRRPSIDPSHRVPMPMDLEPQLGGEGPKQNALDLTAYMMELLNHVPQNEEDGPTFWEDRETLLESELARLQQHRSGLPSLPRSGLPAATLSAVAQHHVDVQLVLMVLYCQILRSTSRGMSLSRRLQDLRKPAARSYYEDLLGSLRSTVEIFDYAYGLDATGTASNWPRCFGLFCAVSMLGIAKLRRESDLDSDKERIEMGSRIFKDLANTTQTSGLARSAAESLDKILKDIDELGQQPSGATATFTGSAPLDIAGTDISNVLQPSAPRTSRSARRVGSGTPALKRGKRPHSGEDDRRRKRVKSGEQPGASESSLQTPTWPVGQVDPYPQALSFDRAAPAPPQEPAASQGVEGQPFPQSGASSFTGQPGFFGTEYVPSHPDNLGEYHPSYHWVHPPMVYAPPLYDDWWQFQFQSEGNMALDGSVQPMFYDLHPPLALPADTWTLETPAPYDGRVFGSEQQGGDGQTRRQSASRSRIPSPASDQPQLSRRSSQMMIETTVMKAAHNPAEEQSSHGHYYDGTMANEGSMEHLQDQVAIPDMVTTGPLRADGQGQRWAWAS